MKTLKPSDLQPADVLLFHGNGFLSKFIRLFDGSQYSHAAIYDGENIVEAEVEQGDAIRVDTVATAVASASFTHVYRFISNDRKHIGDGGLPAAPILKQIEVFKNDKEGYAYSQIFLLGILLATRRIPDISGIAPMLRPFMDEAAEKINEFINGSRKVIICSELVYECFNQATSSSPEYQIDIEGVDPAVLPCGLAARTNLMPAIVPAHDSADLSKDAAAFLSTYWLARGELKQRQDDAKQRLTSQTPILPRADAAFVTPRDLATSPNLVFVGSLVLDSST